MDEKRLVRDRTSSQKNLQETSAFRPERKGASADEAGAPPSGAP